MLDGIATGDVGGKAVSINDISDGSSLQDATLTTNGTWNCGEWVEWSSIRLLGRKIDWG